MNDETPNENMNRLSQLSSFLTYRISRLHVKLNTQASKILRESVGITLNQWRMIAFIGGAKEITASELNNYTAMDKGLISRNVKSLIELGLVQAKPHETDHRVQVLCLTPGGQDVFEKALPRMTRRQADLQSNLSDEDIEIFRRVMDVLEKAAEDTAA